MDEKKLEKLIVDGFKAQDKKIEGIANELRSVKVDMVTQDDLDQRFSDHTTMIMKELDQRFDSVDTQFDRLNVKVDKRDRIQLNLYQWLTGHGV